MFNRRVLYRKLAYVVGGATTISRFVSNAWSGDTSAFNRRIITLFLNGGNDGLNTVIPVSDPIYRHLRRDLRIDQQDAISLGHQMFFHPSFRALMDVWDAGRLNIQQGVGYPNATRSHFESIAVWSEGRLDAQSPSFDGWLGRALDPLQQKSEQPLACAIDSYDTPELLRGRYTRTTSLPDVSAADAPTLADWLSVEPTLQGSSSSEVANQDSEVRRAVAAACRDAAIALRKRSATDQHIGRFPRSTLGQKMAKVATVIQTMPEIKAIHVTQNGYDTHQTQRLQHAYLLQELAESLNALDRFLVDQGLSDSTLVMVYSEFGRRVKENASQGTDHGAAGPVFLIGGGVPGGIYGRNPDLENLQHGDVAFTRDLRELYDPIKHWVSSDDAKLFLPT